MDEDHLPYQVLAQVILRPFKLTKNIETINGSQFLFIKQNFQFLYSTPYPASLTPRDKKPSHSFSEELFIYLAFSTQTSHVFHIVIAS